MKGKKVILWGCGKYGKDFLTKYYFPLDCIEAVVDSDKQKWGEEVFGVSVSSPENLRAMDSDSIVVCSEKYFDEIKDLANRLYPDKKVFALMEYLEEYFVRIDEKNVSNACFYDGREKFFDRVHEAGMIPQSLLKDTRVLADRNEAVKLMKTGGVIGEVGVAYGDFSHYLITHMKPKHFYAIDYFQGGGNSDFWGRDDIKKSGLNHEQWYRKRFYKYIPERMTVCSGYSWECLKKIENDTFDYLYIDASHEYEDVKKDLAAALEKVKNGGVIQINDYTLWDIYEKSYYGVVPAVNEFINQTKSEVLYYCLQECGFNDVVIRLNKG